MAIFCRPTLYKLSKHAERNDRYAPIQGTSFAALDAELQLPFRAAATIDHDQKIPGGPFG